MIRELIAERRKIRSERNGGHGREAMRRIEAARARDAAAVEDGAYMWVRLECIDDNSDFVEGYVIAREHDHRDVTMEVGGKPYSLHEYEIRAIKRLHPTR